MNRLSGFSVLIEAKYLPLLFLAAPQSYTVCLWLSDSNEGKPLALLFAIIGAMAFEMAYVGSIAWAEMETSGNWFWITAFSALIFSVLVAITLYWDKEGIKSLLHSGFPFVAFFYTMTMHFKAKPQSAGDLVKEVLETKPEYTLKPNEYVYNGPPAPMMAPGDIISVAPSKADPGQSWIANVPVLANGQTGDWRNYVELLDSQTDPKKLTQEEIAQAVGKSRVSVNKHLNKVKAVKSASESV